MTKNIIKNACIDAFLTALYIVLIATFLSNTSHIFGGDNGDSKTVLIPIMMLLLLVISAAITGSLVFGRPILWYLDGKKKEAIYLLGYTIGILFIIAFIVSLLLYSIVR